MAQTTIAGKFLDPTVISALDAITDGASASDFLLVWDASDSTLKKLLPDNLGLGAATIKTTYASHGLAVGDVVKPSGTDNQYNKALATTAANAEVVGIVTVVSGNAVTITISGEISTGGVSGFDYADATAGTILFLSATAGLLTSTEPTTEGQISKPVAIVTQDDAKIVLIIQRGEVISTGVQTDAPNDATYVTLSTNSTLTAERTLAAGSGITLADAGANGAATISIANDAIDSQHYAAGSIDNEHLADDAVGIAELSATGTASSSTFLRGDNAWAAAGGGPSQATQSALEAETNEDTYAPPDLLRHAPGMCKAHVSIAWQGTIELGSYNVDSITDTGTGDRTIVWDTDFSSDDYTVTASLSVHVEIAMQVAAEHLSKAVGSIRVRVFDADSNALSDRRSAHSAFGDQ